MTRRSSRLTAAPVLLAALLPAAPGHAEDRFPTIPPADYTPVTGTVTTSE